MTDDILNVFVHVFPALDTIVKSPCDCEKEFDFKGYDRLWFVIMHLNDRDQWTREEIADWLDTFDLDLSFSPKQRISL